MLGRYIQLLLITTLLLLSACKKIEDGSGSGSVADSDSRMTSTEELQSRSGEGIDLETHPGVGLFEANCLSCHAGGVPKAPAVLWLEMMEPDMVLHSMNEGIMKQQSAHLSKQERIHIAEYLARTKLADYKPPQPPKACTGAALKFAGSPPAKTGWGHETSRFYSARQGGLIADDIPKLELKWAYAFPGSVRARSQPAMGWNSIFVGSQNGRVYAFDIETGCAKWTFRAGAEVRTAIVADVENERLYFGDILGRAYAIDAKSGKQIWRTKIDEHPNATITGSPALGGGTLFVPVSSLEVTSAADPEYSCCTFRGSVAALDPANGKLKWQTFTVPDKPKPHGTTSTGAKIIGPSGAPIWNSPAYDAKRGVIYAGSGENYSSPADENSDAVFAIDAQTGQKKWQLQLTKNDAWNVGCMLGNENCPKENGPDYDIASSPILVPLGGGRDMLVVGQKSGVVYGIDPDSGRMAWQRRVGHGGTQGGVHFGMSREGSTVYVPIVDMDDTYDGREYDKQLNGAGMHAINAATGKLLWSNKADDICGDRQYCDRGISAASTAVPGAVLAGHLDGRLRAYAKSSGKPLWSFDTTKAVTTISGTKATGGSMSGPGAAVHGGYLVVNSGYGLYYHMPGNVMLVFGKAD